jgi:hypothetical protein
VPAGYRHRLPVELIFQHVTDVAGLSAELLGWWCIFVIGIFIAGIAAAAAIAVITGFTAFVT